MRNKPVPPEDFEAALEAAKLRVTGRRSQQSWLAIVQAVALAFSVAAFQGFVRIILAIALVAGIVLNVVGLIMLHRVVAWWKANKVGTRYDGWR